MKEEFEDQLRESFPRLGKTPINCDDGWFNLIFALLTTVSESASIFSLNTRNGKLHVEATPPHGDPRSEGAIQMAQNASIFICEKCGAPGKLCLKMGEQRTLCATHTEVDLT